MEELINKIYFSDLQTKLQLLKALDESYMDRFDEEAPTEDCQEMQISKKIAELSKLIEEIGS